METVLSKEIRWKAEEWKSIEANRWDCEEFGRQKRLEESNKGDSGQQSSSRKIYQAN